MEELHFLIPKLIPYKNLFLNRIKYCGKVLTPITNLYIYIMTWLKF